MMQNLYRKSYTRPVTNYAFVEHKSAIYGRKYYKMDVIESKNWSR